MRAAFNMTTLIVAAHGSADPRSAANTHAVAQQIRQMRPGLDVRVGFLERSTPYLRDVLTGLRDAVVAPLLLADAYHARIDIPALIAASGARAVQADVLGADRRLLRVAHHRLAELGISRHDRDVGVLVVAVGSSHEPANRATKAVAPALAADTDWAGASTAFVTGPQPSVHRAALRLRQHGATRLVIVPWFLAPGRLTDRIAAYAHTHDIALAPPLGCDPLVAATLLDRFDEAAAVRAAA
jgi:sirohydrochlorin ferrochelatase